MTCCDLFTGIDARPNHLQEHELRHKAKRAGWQVAKVYKDHGISGAKGSDGRRRSIRCAGTPPWRGGTISVRTAGNGGCANENQDNGNIRRCEDVGNGRQCNCESPTTMGSQETSASRATPKNPCPPPILLHRLVERGRRAVQRYPPFVGPHPGAFFHSARSAATLLSLAARASRLPNEGSRKPPTYGR
jgi:hypothetical protein